MTYVYVEFPKCKYHPDKEPVVVQNAEEEQALGPDWFDNPTQAAEAKTKLQAAVQKKRYP